MDIHAKFYGDVANTIDEIIKRGRASTKTEAIRLALLDYGRHNFEPTNETKIKPEPKTKSKTPIQLISHANQDIWEDKGEDKIWLKYMKEKNIIGKKITKGKND